MKIAFQGVLGAYSQIAVKKMFKKARPVGFSDFSDAVLALVKKQVNYALLPAFNLTAGRVGDIFFELYKNNVYIIGEYFLKISHNLVGLKNAKLSDIKYIYSHPQALAQSSNFINKHNYKKIPFFDTAGALKYIIENKIPNAAAICSSEASEIYGGRVLKRKIENEKSNQTRFILLSRKLVFPKDKENSVTSIFFTTKNKPAALYKALGAFATRNINLRVIESFMPTLSQKNALFYLEIERDLRDSLLKDAFSELSFFTQDFKVAGSFSVFKK